MEELMERSEELYAKTKAMRALVNSLEDCFFSKTNELELKLQFFTASELFFIMSDYAETINKLAYELTLHAERLSNESEGDNNE